jgi:hypothetical protein
VKRCAAVRQLIKAGYSNWWNEKTCIILSRKIAGATDCVITSPQGPSHHRPIPHHRPIAHRFGACLLPVAHRLAAVLGSAGAAAASNVEVDYWALFLQSWVFLAMAAGTFPLILVAVPLRP